MHGTEARMRVSSVMRPPPAAEWSCGTFRSARVNTCLPAAKPLLAISANQSTFMVWYLALASATHNAHHLEHLVRVAPLVVVPGDDLDEGLVQRNAGVCIEHRGHGLAAEVGRHHLVLGVAEHALHRTQRRGLHRGADLGVARL